MRLDIIETMLDLCEIMANDYNAVKLGDPEAREKGVWSDKWRKYAEQLNDEHYALCYGVRTEHRGA